MLKKSTPHKEKEIRGDGKICVKTIKRGDCIELGMDKFDEAGQQRMRALGREFLNLCIAYIEQPTPGDALDLASELGATYGREIASRGIPLADALQAFIFFRNATTDAIRPTLTRRGASADEVSIALRELSRLTDQVLMSLTACYHQAPLAVAPKTKTKTKAK